MRITALFATCILAFSATASLAQAAPTPVVTPAERAEIRRDQRETRQDKRDLRQDRRERNRDVRQAVR